MEGVAYYARGRTGTSIGSGGMLLETPRFGGFGERSCRRITLFRCIFKC